jgi:hypothetical protein
MSKRELSVYQKDWLKRVSFGSATLHETAPGQAILESLLHTLGNHDGPPIRLGFVGLPMYVAFLHRIIIGRQLKHKDHQTTTGESQ